MRKKNDGNTNRSEAGLQNPASVIESPPLPAVVLSLPRNSSERLATSLVFILRELWLNTPVALRENIRRVKQFAGEKQEQAIDGSIELFTEWLYRKYQGREMKPPELISREKYPRAKPKPSPWSACAVN